MATEIEIKLAIRDGKALQRALNRLRAKPANPKAPRVHEMNLIFDTPDGGLAKHGQLLRIRTETPAPAKKGPRGKAARRTVLTFKSPPEELAIGDVGHVGDRRHKVREEIETELTDGATMQRIFEGLGLRGWFRYEKYRTTYVLPGRHAWAKGLLIEVEAAAIDRAAKELGYSPKEYVLKNYLVLYVEECKRKSEPPKDMLFGGEKRGR